MAAILDVSPLAQLLPDLYCTHSVFTKSDNVMEIILFFFLKIIYEFKNAFLIHEFFCDHQWDKSSECWHNISDTKKSISSHFQTPRNGLSFSNH